MARLDSVTASSTLQATAAALKPAHSFQNRLLCGAGRKLCKRDHFSGKDRISRLVTPWPPVPINAPAAQAASQCTAASGDQVDDQEDQRDHQQKVDEATCYVKAEAQNPQNKKNDENCPKHIRHTSLDCERLRRKTRLRRTQRIY